MGWGYSAEPCVDEYTGDCSVDFAGQCSDPIVMKVCERTCGICAVQAAKTTTPATVPADDTTTDMATTSACHDTYLGDCLTEFSGQCTDSIVREVCKKSCGVCSAKEL
nr:hypothetical protein BaRGS_029402 [Batillaria attramentaria]